MPVLVLEQAPVRLKPQGHIPLRTTVRQQVKAQGLKLRPPGTAHKNKLNLPERGRGPKPRGAALKLRVRGLKLWVQGLQLV
jgi:hypothetical protein